MPDPTSSQRQPNQLAPYLLVFWLLAFVTVGLTRPSEIDGIILGALYLALPAMATLPVAFKYLFGSTQTVTRVFFATLAVGLSGIVAWQLGRITELQLVLFLTPAFQFLVVAGSYRAFLRFLGRQPNDVTLNFSPGLMWDRIFGLIALLISFLVPINVYWAFAL